MLKKFTPHFRGLEDDLKSEMMIALIKAIRRIRRNEIRSIQNYLITTMKYAAFAVAKDIIAYDRTTYYLEDLKKQHKFDNNVEWEDLFDMGYFSYETILSTFETFEERYIVLNLMKREGYSKRNLKKILGCSWEDINLLQVRVREKLIEVIKMYTT